MRVGVITALQRLSSGVLITSRFILMESLSIHRFALGVKLSAILTHTCVRVM